MLQAEDPLQLIQRVMIIQIVPLKTMVYHIGANLHTATHGRAHTTAGGYGLKDAEWSEWRVPSGTDSWPELQPVERSPHRSR